MSSLDLDPWLAQFLEQLAALQIYVDTHVPDTATINENGDLIFTYIDAPPQNLGHVVGADGVSVVACRINGAGNLLIILSNGVTLTAGRVTGTNGTSVTAATINSGGNLIITLSNGQQIDAGRAQGATGAAGINLTAPLPYSDLTTYAPPMSAIYNGSSYYVSAPVTAVPPVDLDGVLNYPWKLWTSAGAAGAGNATVTSFAPDVVGTVSEADGLLPTDAVRVYHDAQQRWEPANGFTPNAADLMTMAQDASTSFLPDIWGAENLIRMKVAIGNLRYNHSIGLPYLIRGALNGDSTDDFVDSATGIIGAYRLQFGNGGTGWFSANGDNYIDGAVATISSHKPYWNNGKALLLSGCTYANNVVTFQTVTPHTVQVGGTFSITNVSPTVYNQTYVALTGTNGASGILKGQILLNPAQDNSITQVGIYYDTVNPDISPSTQWVFYDAAYTHTAAPVPPYKTVGPDGKMAYTTSTTATWKISNIKGVRFFFAFGNSGGTVNCYLRDQSGTILQQHLNVYCDPTATDDVTFVEFTDTGTSFRSIEFNTLPTTGRVEFDGAAAELDDGIVIYKWANGGMAGNQVNAYYNFPSVFEIAAYVNADYSDTSLGTNDSGAGSNSTVSDFRTAIDTIRSVNLAAAPRQSQVCSSMGQYYYVGHEAQWGVKPYAYDYVVAMYEVARAIVNGVPGSEAAWYNTFDKTGFLPTAWFSGFWKTINLNFGLIDSIDWDAGVTTYFFNQSSYPATITASGDIFFPFDCVPSGYNGEFVVTDINTASPPYWIKAAVPVYPGTVITTGRLKTNDKHQEIKGAWFWGADTIVSLGLDF